MLSRGIISGDQSSIALADQAVVSGGNFLTMVIVGRILAAENFGLFSLAMMSFLFMSNLHRAVLTQPMNIFGAAESPEEQIGRLRVVLHSHLVALPIASLILAVASAVFFPDFLLLLALTAAFCCFALQETMRRYWYTRRDFAKALENDFISYGGQVLVLILLAWLKDLTATTAFIVLALTSLAAFIHGRFRRLEAPVRLVSTNWQEIIRQQRSITLWLLLTVLAVWGAGPLYPFLMLPLGVAVIAAYSACRTVLSAMNLVVQSVSNYLPTKARLILEQEGKEAFRKHMLRTCSQSLLLGFIFLLALHLLAEPLLHFFYGGRYDHAAPVMRILAYGTVCSLMGVVFGAYALAMEDPRSGFLANLGATVVTFSIGLWLIRDFGIRGAAIAVSLSMATAMIVQALFVVRRYCSLPFGDPCAR